ncbi:hypothetical protein OG21DRAFT_1521305 [Imleria badia]|nr:hypothetical protein OG21DRAFT_1521305 [Imleria badia]
MAAYGSYPPLPIGWLTSASEILNEQAFEFWEFFVLAMAPVVATSKPFSPTVHVLILPTQLPLDMRHAFRNLDELALNCGFVPDHMNILSTQAALEHVRGVFPGCTRRGVTEWDGVAADVLLG